MRLAFCSVSALDRPLAAAAEVAAAAGVDGIEVTARAPHLDPEAGVGAARAAGNAVRAAGLEVTAYGSYLGRPGFVGWEHAVREVGLATALGTQLLRVWAEPLEGHAERDVASHLRDACDAAAGEDITVVVERHLGSFADTPERVEALLRAVDRENFALNYQVLDFLPPQQIGEQPADAARLIALARYAHLKNYRANPERDGPLLPGGSLAEGVLDYRAILAAMRSGGYADPLAIEFLSFEDKPLEEKLRSDVAFVREALAAAERP